MESIKKRQPLYWINPNARLRFPYYSIEWHLCDHQDLFQDQRKESPFRKVYRAKTTCVIILNSEDLVFRCC